MRIQIQSRGIELEPRLRQYVERRTRFALSRFDDQVQTVVVRLADLNGPRGGLDQRCQVELTLRSGERTIVDSTDFLIEVAVGRAMRTSARRVGAMASKKRTLRLRDGARRKTIERAYEDPVLEEEVGELVGAGRGADSDMN